MNAQTSAGVANGALTRLLKPQTTAVVGLNDMSGLLKDFRRILVGDAEIFFATPSEDNATDARRPGGISVVSQSGALLSGVATAAWNHNGCRLNLLINSGDEIITDLAEYVDFLADDPGTRAIGLIAEKIRRPEAFFAAARRAAAAGKPIALVKLARVSPRTCAPTSGSLGEDAWMYDVALRQAGIAVVDGPGELVRRLATSERPVPWPGDALPGLTVAESRDRPPLVTALPRPEAAAITPPEGQPLPFDATMELLAATGIPVAAYHLVAEDQNPLAVRPPFPGPYAVKLADVRDRPEHGAVHLGVSAEDLAATVIELRALAAGHGLSSLVVVQRQVEIFGEAFIGILPNSEIGPMVVFGPGGVAEKVPQRVGGRMAPLSMSDAQSLIAEFAHVGAIHGCHGRPAWDLEVLAGILVAAGKLAAAVRSWMDLLDLNVLLDGPSGFVVVDALCLTRDEATGS